MNCNREEKLVAVRKIVDKLSGNNNTRINKIGVFNTDITEVNFITRDPSGTIKGFVKKPVYNDAIGAYLAEVKGESAYFNAIGKEDDGGIMVPVFHYKEFLGELESKEKPRKTLKEMPDDFRQLMTVSDLISLLVARNEVLMLPKLEFEEKRDIFEIVVQLFGDEDPLIIINASGTGEIVTEKRTVVIFE